MKKRLVSFILMFVMVFAMMLVSANAQVEAQHFPTDFVDFKNPAHPHYTHVAKMTGIACVMGDSLDNGIHLYPEDPITTEAFIALATRNIMNDGIYGSAYIPTPIQDRWSIVEFTSIMNSGIGGGVFSYLEGSGTRYNIGTKVNRTSSDEVIEETYLSACNVAFAAALCVSITGYDQDAIAEGGYPYGYMKTAEKLGIFKETSITLYDANNRITKTNAITMIDNTINVPLWLTSEELNNGKINFANFRHNYLSPYAKLCDGSAASGRYETLATFVNRIYPVRGRLTYIDGKKAGFYIESSQNFMGQKAYGQDIILNEKVKEKEKDRSIILEFSKIGSLLNKPADALVHVDTNGKATLLYIGTGNTQNYVETSLAVTPNTGKVVLNHDTTTATWFEFTAKTSPYVNEISLVADMFQGAEWYELTCHTLKTMYGLEAHINGDGAKVWTCRLPLYNTGERVIKLKADGAMTNAYVALNVFDASQQPISVTVGGKAVNFDVPPQIIEGRTMIPLRAVTEALGAEVTWKAGTQSITIKGPVKNNNSNIWMNLDIGSNHLSYIRYNKDFSESISDGFHIILDSPPVLVDGRTLVPIRAIAETMWYDVEWDAANRQVIIK